MTYGIIIPSIFGIAAAIGIIIYFIYQNSKFSAKLELITEQRDQYKAEIISLEETNDANLKKIAEITAHSGYQEKLLKDISQMREKSEQTMKSVLFDMGKNLSHELRENFKQESKELKENFKQETKENREISQTKIHNITSKVNNEFERIVSMVGELNKEVSQSRDTVDIIKNALLSPSGAGHLAEITLENILKSSGLRPKLDFILQYHIKNDQNSLRPDAVIFLPGNNLMVIDAKSSKFLVDQQSDPKKLAQTMNMHLRSLSHKAYGESIKTMITDRNIGAVKYVMTMMFLPSEQAIEKINNADNNFQHNACKFNIFPVGPTGLMNMLSLAKYQISEQQIIENHKNIMEHVRTLIKSVNTMTDYSKKMGSSIMSAVTHYDKFAGSFNHNFLSKVKQISKMGVAQDIPIQPSQLERVQILKSDLIDINNQQTNDNQDQPDDAPQKYIQNITKTT